MPHLPLQVCSSEGEVLPLFDIRTAVLNPVSEAKVRVVTLYIAGAGSPRPSRPCSLITCYGRVSSNLKHNIPADKARRNKLYDSSSWVIAVQFFPMLPTAEQPLLHSQPTVNLAF
ncbi:uncharacterized protein GLRG_06105 [Colletotrichum graminicola M1.001]|uniref:Uncharacterized protein n=1 Tax=Colletotrichum graminicola (strain M1.001 / M2 / FGSC 10212) TaxID=645133 RepID=E3QJC3_COLGM|nr:uncharacterized protein GLRG_06105 [Colletotrichum graminicola M1.001]EFQ30961.1 hypothetical protein GLRG_06105 [Colletotrichum graminicola M1.001]